MSKCPAAESTLQKCPFLHGKKKEEAEALENPDAATESDGKKRGGCPHLQGKPEAVGGDAAIKKYFAESYNKLSGHAMTRGDVDVAKVLANKLGYSEREIAVIGQDDLSNMMGTGNPHMHAGITAGDVVVDLGSGLGLDAFVAADKVGSSGRVIGVDLAKGEVQHATQRAQDRGVKNVEFQVGDMENLENIATGSVDVCISNGGFCLVPSKQKAFAAMFRVLKKGGRISISCTTLRKELCPGIKWPICMEQFMALSTAADVVRAAGFVDVQIDTSNSKMSVWDDAKAEAPKKKAEEEEQDMCSHARKAKAAREAAEEKGEKVVSTIHKGDPSYSHLKDVDMDEMCARVTIYARKPSSKCPWTKFKNNIKYVGYAVVGVGVLAGLAFQGKRLLKLK